MIQHYRETSKLVSVTTNTLRKLGQVYFLSLSSRT